jgi:predicted transcriptional regulator
LRLGFNATGDVRGLYVDEEGLHALAGPRGEDLLRLLKLEGPKTPTEISVALGQSANSIHQLLLRLRRRRLIVSDQGRYLCSG